MYMYTYKTSTLTRAHTHIYTYTHTHMLTNETFQAHTWVISQSSIGHVAWISLDLPMSGSCHAHE